MKKFIGYIFCLSLLCIVENSYSQTGNPYWDARVETSKQEQNENSKILAKGNKAYKKQEEENKKRKRKFLRFEIALQENNKEKKTEKKN